MPHVSLSGPNSMAHDERDRIDEILARDFEAAARRGEAEEALPIAVEARYDASSGRVLITFNNGCLFAFPAALAQGLENAAPEALAEIEIWGGQGLHWPALDVDLSVPGLLMGIFGTEAYMASQRAARAGAVRSPRKAAAARSNGAKGGRPRKTRTAAE